MSSEVQFSVLSSNVWNPAISSVCMRSDHSADWFMACSHCQVNR